MCLGYKMANVLIKATNVRQQFQVGDETVTPIKGASFSITENSFNIVYGPSGSGKSTLLNVLTGLQKPTSGRVEVEGKDVYALTPDELAYFRANRIGIVYQTNFWVKSLNVLENVAMPLYYMGYPRSVAGKIAMLSLDRINMGAFAKKYPALLSGGEQQRIAMARALAADPLFIIADEPTGNLDSKNGDIIMDQLRICQEDFKRTIILVTHNMEYLPLADHLLHIEDGKIAETQYDSIQKTVEALMGDMRDRVRRLTETKRHVEKDRKKYQGK